MSNPNWYCGRGGVLEADGWETACVRARPRVWGLPLQSPFRLPLTLTPSIRARRAPSANLGGDANPLKLITRLFTVRAWSRAWTTFPLWLHTPVTAELCELPTAYCLLPTA